MKVKFKLSIIAASLFALALAQNSRAEEKGGIEFVKKSEIYNCEAEEERLFAKFGSPQECNIDTQCEYFNYGYPFQPSACRKAIISTADEEQNVANFANLMKFRTKCIESNSDKLEKFEKLAEEIESQQCNMIRLYCFKGYCRTKNYSTIRNDSSLR